MKENPYQEDREHIKELLQQYENLRSGLIKAVDSFNKSAGSLESRVLVQARKLKELGGASGEDIEPLGQIEQTPRLLNMADTGEEGGGTKPSKRAQVKSIDSLPAAAGEAE